MGVWFAEIGKTHTGASFTHSSAVRRCQISHASHSLSHYRKTERGSGWPGGHSTGYRGHQRISSQEMDPENGTWLHYNCEDKQ